MECNDKGFSQAANAADVSETLGEDRFFEKRAEAMELMLKLTTNQICAKCYAFVYAQQRDKCGGCLVKIYKANMRCQMLSALQGKGIESVRGTAMEKHMADWESFDFNPFSAGDLIPKLIPPRQPVRGM